MGIVYMVDNINYRFSGAYLEELKRLYPSMEFYAGEYEEIMQDVFAQIEVFFGGIRPKDLEGCAALKWLQLPSAGVSEFLSCEAIKSGKVALTNSRGVYGPAIAEHILAMFLSARRNLHKYRDAQAQRKWIGLEPQLDFEGSTVGIIGLGDIGSHLAMKCHGLGTRVLGAKRTPGEKPDYVDELYTMDQVEELILRSDFLALCMPETPDTLNTLSKERIAMLKPGVVIANIGRGSAIDQDALLEALQSGKVAAACLDVVSPEPLPPESPLWGQENCIITCHSAGRSLGNGKRNLQIFEENLKNYMEGRPLRNKIDVNKGY